MWNTFKLTSMSISSNVDQIPPNRIFPPGWGGPWPTRTLVRSDLPFYNTRTRPPVEPCRNTNTQQRNWRKEWKIKMANESRQWWWTINFKQLTRFSLSLAFCDSGGSWVFFSLKEGNLLYVDLFFFYVCLILFVCLPLNLLCLKTCDFHASFLRFAIHMLFWVTLINRWWYLNITNRGFYAHLRRD